MNLAQYSINQIEQMARYGSITEQEVTDYLRAWNAGPHFTQAVWADGAIRNFDPEQGGAYCQLWGKYGVRP